MMLRRLIVAVLLVGALRDDGNAAAQEVRAGASVDVSIVNVDVFVTDKAGKRVHGLAASDFEIYEDGKRQQVSNFAEYMAGATGESGVDGGTPDALQPRQKRNILIFFERMQLEPQQVDPLIAGIKQTLERIVMPGDSVAVVMWEPSQTMQVDFTDDLATINMALDRVAERAKTAQTDKAKIARDEAAMMRSFETAAAEFGDRASRAGRGNGAATVTNSGFTPPVPQDRAGTNVPTQLAMLTAYAEMKQRIAAIDSAIDSLAGGDGKKILLLATHRLGEVAGAEFAYADGAQRIADNVRLRFGTESLLNRIINNANASGVTVYPIYPIGLRFADSDTDSTEAPAMASGITLGSADQLTLANENVALQHVARGTGGITASGLKDILQILPRIGEDVTDYYSLAYRVTTANADRARDIVVKTRNSELAVRSRRQFVEKSEQTQMRDRMVAALFRADNQPPIPITAQIGNVKTVKRKVVVPIAVQVPIAWLTMLPQQDGGKYAGEFSVLTGAAADLDELSGLTRKSQKFEIAEKDLERAKSGYFTYDLAMTVNEKTKYLAVGVFDEVGKSYGTVRLELKTPEGK